MAVPLQRRRSVACIRRSSFLLDEGRRLLRDELIPLVANGIIAHVRTGFLHFGVRCRVWILFFRFFRSSAWLLLFVDCLALCSFKFRLLGLFGLFSFIEARLCIVLQHHFVEIALLHQVLLVLFAHRRQKLPVLKNLSQLVLWVAVELNRARSYHL